MAYDNKFWEKIKNEFIQGNGSGDHIEYPNYHFLSKKYKVNCAHLIDKARKQHWEIEKELYFKKINEKKLEKLRTPSEDFEIQTVQNIVKKEKKTIDKKIDILSSIAAKSDVKCILLTYEILNIAKESIATMKKQVKKLRQEDEFIICPPDEVKKITDYIKTAQTIIKTSTGENQKPEDNLTVEEAEQRIKSELFIFFNKEINGN